MSNYNDYYFYVSSDEDGMGWEFTISDLVESELVEFPTKEEKISFLKSLIEDIEQCINRLENKETGKDGNEK